MRVRLLPASVVAGGRFFEEREKALAAQAEKMKADAQANEQSEELVKQLQEQEARLKQQQEEATRKFEAEQDQMKRRAEELEQKLHEQIKETERQARKQQREIRERSLLDEKLLKTIPLVNEANAISDELQRNMNFSVKLMANPNRQRVSHRIDSDDEEEEPVSGGPHRRGHRMLPCGEYVTVPLVSAGALCVCGHAGGPNGAPGH